MSTRLFKTAMIVGLILIFGSSFKIYLEKQLMGETLKKGDMLKSASYKYGQTIIVKSFDINTKGGLFEISNTGTAIDGTIVEIPEGALDKEMTLSVGYNDGILDLRSGEASGITIVLSTEQKIIFQKPVTIKIHFDPSINPKTIVGYSIDEQGRIRPIDIKSSPRKKTGEVSFYIFYMPIMFTWVYVP